MPHKYLTDLIQTAYPTISQSLPPGRRARILKVLHTNWPRVPPTAAAPSADISWEDVDQDPMDASINSSESQGILLRTDFTNDAHWESFISKMQESEKELLESFRPGSEASTSTNDVEMGSTNNEQGDDGSSDEEDGQLPESVITPFNPPPTSHVLLSNISNLAALRLFNDVDIRSAIPPPPELESSKYKPNNVLINLNGWQEVYEGKNLWIYDSKSIQDDCVRLVEQAGAVYGAATGDSWRARITHIPELQFNMAFLGMKIDFGGLDRWDANERARNLAEATVL